MVAHRTDRGHFTAILLLKWLLRKNSQTFYQMSFPHWHFYCIKHLMLKQTCTPIFSNFSKKKQKNPTNNPDILCFSTSPNSLILRCFYGLKCTLMFSSINIYLYEHICAHNIPQMPQQGGANDYSCISHAQSRAGRAFAGEWTGSFAEVTNTWLSLWKHVKWSMFFANSWGKLTMWVAFGAAWHPHSLNLAGESRKL